MTVAAPPRPVVSPWRIAPAAAAALAAIAYLVAAPQSVDLAAHVYRAGLFGRQGLGVWDPGWYAGHHTLGYSVLFPPLAWLLGPRGVGALAAVCAAACFEQLAHRHFGERARAGALWFGVATVTLLMSGRMPFALGVAFALAALLALDRERAGLAVALAVACACTSPVAAVFLALAAASVGLAVRSRAALVLAATAIAVTGALVLAFPEGGHEPWPVSGFWPVLVFCALAAIALPRERRALRIGAALYGVGALVAFAVPTPMGSNTARLGELFAAPLLLLAAPARWRPPPLLLLVALAWWQWNAAIGDVNTVAGQRSASAAYFAPLNAELARRGAGLERVEIPFTRLHWEAAYVAPRFPLARGWERQLDIARDGLFYARGGPTAATYAAWLEQRAVRFVALPNAPLDPSGEGEARLIRSGLPYLVQRWRSRDWRLYEFTLARPLVAPIAPADIRAVATAGSGLVLRVAHPGAARVAVAWSPYWRLAGGCVARDGDWTRITARRTGTLRLEPSFSLARVFERGPRCS